jgi:hypothetical protein
VYEYRFTAAAKTWSPIDRSDVEVGRCDFSVTVGTFVLFILQTTTITKATKHVEAVAQPTVLPTPRAGNSPKNSTFAVLLQQYDAPKCVAVASIEKMKAKTQKP